MLGDLRAGAAEVFRHTWLWLLIGQALLYHLFYGGVQGVLGPIVVGDEFGTAAWGWSLALLMAGFMVGGLVTLCWRPRHGLAVGTVLLVADRGLPAALALSDSLPLVLVGAFVHGLGLEIFSVNWDLSIQQKWPRTSWRGSTPSTSSARSWPGRWGWCWSARSPRSSASTRGCSRSPPIMAGSSLLAATVPSVRRLERRV